MGLEGGVGPKGEKIGIRIIVMGSGLARARKSGERNKKVSSSLKTHWNGPSHAYLDGLP